MKPRVRYIDLGSCIEGQPARLIPFDHPNKSLNGQWITTTKVQSIVRQARGPVFQTRNTVYWPGETDESLPKYKTEVAKS